MTTGGGPISVTRIIRIDATKFSVADAVIDPAIGAGSPTDKDVSHPSAGSGRESFTVSGSRPTPQMGHFQRASRYACVRSLARMRCD